MHGGPPLDREDVSEQSSSTASDAPPSERLDSWKEIAAYLRREVRTVQRWEKEEGLPVHRSPHKRQGRIYAYKAELDAWWNDGHARLAELEEADYAGVEPSGEYLQATTERMLDATSRASLPRWVVVTVLLIVAMGLSATLAWKIAESRAAPVPPRVATVLEITSDSYWKDSLATDGQRAYYIEELSGHRLLTVASPDAVGASPQSIPLAMEHPRLLGISPRGNRLLLVDSRFGEPGALMTLGLPAATPLSSVPSAIGSCAAWSPDESWVAFCRGSSVFRLVEGSAPAKLASFQGKPDSLAWAPDGRSIRVVVLPQPPSTSARAPEEGLSLWEIAVPSGNARPLPLPASVDRDCSASTTWTGDNRYFVLASRCGGSSGIWLLPSRLGAPASAAAWIPLRANFSRVTQVAATPRSQSLEVLEAESGPLQLMHYYPESQKWIPVQLGTNPVEVNYSRDGRWLSYVEYPQRTLWRMRADGSHRIQLTFPPLQAQLPEWSPDGKTIAFSGELPGANWKVYLVPANGGPARPAEPSESDQGAPTWSADGRALVFGDVETAGSASHFIRYLDLGTKRLTNIPGSAGLRTSRWSPDGRYIAALRYRVNELALYEVATRRWKTAATGVHSDELNWSFDSRYLYFNCRYEPYPGIYRYDLRQRKLETVMRFGSFREGPDLNPDVGGFSLVPDGSILVNASPQSSHIYAITLKP